MTRDTLMLAYALALALPGTAPFTRAVAQAATAPAPTPAAPAATAPPPAGASADATAAPSESVSKGRGRKTVGQGMNAQAEAGEPRVDTSAAGANAGGIATAAGANAGGTATAAGANAGGTATATAAGANAGGTAAAAGAPKTAKTPDRVDLDTTTVTGNRELPKVMYVVPWKKSDIGELDGKPMNSLLDEVLAPVDRDVFRREVVYYQAVNSQASQSGAGDAASAAAGAKQVEK